MAVRGQRLWLLCPGLPHPPPPPAPHHCIQRAAPGLPAALRLGRGPGGWGSRAGPALALSTPPPAFPQARSRLVAQAGENEWASGAHCSGKALGAPSASFPHPPADPAGHPQRFSPPPSWGARRGRGLGRKEPGKGGVGAGRRGVGGGEGGSGGPAALCPGGALRCGRGSCLPVSHPCSPPPSAAVKACVSLGTPGGPFPREALGWR